VSVHKRLVRHGGAIVWRNVREPSEELVTPSAGRDVHNPHHLALTRKAHQQGCVLKSWRQFADSEVERVGLGPSMVQKRAEEWEVELEPCDAILSRNRIPPPRLTALQAIILQRVAIGNSPATRSFKQIRLIY
jgi:hypothetical protein